ncbi:hypothetical protein PO909_016857 [Leuciscus waleckii]
MTGSCLHRDDTIKSSNSTCPRSQRERPSQLQNSGSTRSVSPGPFAMRHSYLVCFRWLGNTQTGMPICFCWNLAGCGRLKKVGWSLTLQQLAISG